MTRKRPRQIHLTLPEDIVPSLNRLYAANRHTRARLAKEAHEAVAWAAVAALGNPIVPLPGPVRVCISAFAVRPKDADNYLKTLLDGLVLAGVLKDDGYKYLAELRVRVSRVGREQARIEVHIQEAS